MKMKMFESINLRFSCNSLDLVSVTINEITSMDAERGTRREATTGGSWGTGRQLTWEGFCCLAGGRPVLPGASRGANTEISLRDNGTFHQLKEAQTRENTKPSRHKVCGLQRLSLPHTPEATLTLYSAQLF